MKTKIKIRTLVGAVAVALSFFSLPLLSVWKKSTVVNMIEKNANLEKKIAEFHNGNIVLRFEINELMNRSRIEEFARNNLELDYPDNNMITVLVRPVAKSKKGRFDEIINSIAKITE